MYYTALHVYVMYMYATLIYLEFNGILDTGVEDNTSKFSSEKSTTNITI